MHKELFLLLAVTIILLLVHYYLQEDFSNLHDYDKEEIRILNINKFGYNPTF